jgi:hypothetical protein
MTEKKDRRYARKTPCEECPFRRGCPPGIGNPDPLVYLGQACGPFLLSCHMDPEYAPEKGGQPEIMQCAGAAMFRTSLKVIDMLPDSTHRLEPDGKAFERASELVAHHHQVHEGVGQLTILVNGGLGGLLLKEIKKVTPEMLRVVERKKEG